MFEDDTADVSVLKTFGFPVTSAVPEVLAVVMYYIASNDKERVALVLEQVINNIGKPLK